MSLTKFILLIRIQGWVFVNEYLELFVNRICFVSIADSITYELVKS